MSANARQKQYSNCMEPQGTEKNKFWNLATSVRMFWSKHGQLQTVNMAESCIIEYMHLVEFGIWADFLQNFPQLRTTSISGTKKASSPRPASAKCQGLKVAHALLGIWNCSVKVWTLRRLHATTTTTNECLKNAEDPPNNRVLVNGVMGSHGTKGSFNR